VRGGAASLAALVAVAALATPARAQPSPGVALAAVAAPPPPAAAAEAPRPPEPKPWALTVRGGVSLGAYEAGLSWASLRLFRKREASDAEAALRVITGASAGNINAFLSAISWCQSTAVADAETAANNPFWNAWIPIGFGELFPGPGSPRYRPDDGLLTRSAFDGIESRIKTMLVEPGRFDDRCRARPLRLGVTVTRARPATVCLGKDNKADCSPSGSAIPIKTQRFVLAFDVQVMKPDDPAQAPRLVFTLPRPLDRSVGSELRLVSGAGGYVSGDDLIAVMEASSAFPVAFAPRRITYCEEAQDKDGGKTCRATSDKFFDGGVFDNIPLGLAVNLALRDQCGADDEACLHTRAPAMNFLYMDPGHLRVHRESTADEEVEDENDRRGLGNTIEFLSNFVDVSTQYELQSVDRYLYQPSAFPSGALPQPRLTSHFHPIVGEYLGHFGAFLARPFREYDYYVGVYDTVWNTAQQACDKGPVGGAQPANQLAMASCLVDEIVDIHDRRLALGQPGNEVASYMVKRLLTSELESFVGDRPATRALLLHKVGAPGHQVSAAEWLAAARAPRAVAPTGGDEIALMDALVTTQLEMAAQQRRADELGPRIAGRLDPPAGFTDFVHRLAKALDARSVRREAFFSQDERHLLKDPDRWLRLKAAQAMERLNDIEREDDYAFGKDLTVLSQLITNSDPVRAPALVDLDPSSVPDTFTWLRISTHLLPYYFEGDLLHGGYDIGWRPTVWPLSRLGLALPATPLVWVRGSSRITGAVGGSLVLRLLNPAVTGIEVEPARFPYRYGDLHNVFERTVGGEVTFYLAAGKLRLSVGLNDYAGWRDAQQWTLRFGLADVNGLIYWAIRLLKG
jgi:predicted acylesterase/phospholipase RssA